MQVLSSFFKHMMDLLALNDSYPHFGIWAEMICSYDIQPIP